MTARILAAMLSICACGSAGGGRVGTPPATNNKADQCPRECVISFGVDNLNDIRLFCNEWNREYYLDGTGLHEYWFCSEWVGSDK